MKHLYFIIFASLFFTNYSGHLQAAAASAGTDKLAAGEAPRSPSRGSQGSDGSKSDGTTDTMPEAVRIHTPSSATPPNEAKDEKVFAGYLAAHDTTEILMPEERAFLEDITREELRDLGAGIYDVATDTWRKRIPDDEREAMIDGIIRGDNTAIHQAENIYSKAGKVAGKIAAVLWSCCKARLEGREDFGPEALTIGLHYKNGPSALLKDKSIRDLLSTAHENNWHTYWYEQARDNPKNMGTLVEAKIALGEMPGLTAGDDD